MVTDLVFGEESGVLICIGFFCAIKNHSKFRLFNVFFVHRKRIIHTFAKQNSKNLNPIKMKANKSQIFSKAWNLFRKYNITFSQALIKAWTDFKREFYITIYNSIPSKAQFAKKKVEAKKMYENFNTVSFDLVCRNIANNIGAIHWYDGKTLNLD